MKGRHITKEEQNEEEKVMKRKLLHNGKNEGEAGYDN